MRVALVYPPTCDPTAPYLSVPTLAAYLRTHGVEVLSIDANLEAWEHLLTRGSLERVHARVEERIAELEAKPHLAHADQLVYGQLWAARGDAEAVPPAIDDALRVFRDRKRFYAPAEYDAAVQVVAAAQRAISAAYAPLSVDFVAYRTPFSLLSAEEIARDAEPDRDPFHEYFVALAKRIAASDVSLVGISVAFPGQIQPAYALAHALRAHAPGVHVTVGGPALTQMLIRLEGPRLEKALGPFHTAVVYEGEVALLELARSDLTRRGVIRGTQIEDMSVLPPPDFDGLPLDRYLAPELVLPYDPTRGCYWGVCTFCHYGLAEVGTARYRERPTETVLDHLVALRDKHDCRVFYFSQDVFSPRIATAIAKGIRARDLGIRWGTDMRPERSLNPERSKALFEGGLLQTALGVESAAPRVLSLIDKGIPAADVKTAIESLSSAGVAVEAMCFSDFPTETYREAIETVDFVQGVRDHLSLFILGKFDLTHGSLVAQKPGEFGIREVWEVEGDELGTGLFWAERRSSKRTKDREKLEGAIDALSRGWRLRRYPWAGALSTAHTMLYYVRFGKDVFRALPSPAARVPAAAREHAARFDVLEATRRSAENEAAIWETLTHQTRRVGRAPYEELAARIAPLKPRPSRFIVRVGEVVATGRRPSHAHNAATR
jgi:anaerobic magnesium-protoporphyrin IX monomethyl ester cyclase